MIKHRFQRINLPDSLLVLEDACVLDTLDGLVNGTFGKILQIITKTDTNVKPYVHLIELTMDNLTYGVNRYKQIPRSDGTSFKVQSMSVAVSLKRVFF